MQIMSADDSSMATPYFVLYIFECDEQAGYLVGQPCTREGEILNCLLQRHITAAYSKVTLDRLLRFVSAAASTDHLGNSLGNCLGDILVFQSLGVFLP
jgi:hypothetical protein